MAEAATAGDPGAGGRLENVRPEAMTANIDIAAKCDDDLKTSSPNVDPTRKKNSFFKKRQNVSDSD